MKEEVRGKKKGEALADDTWFGVINTLERVNHHPAQVSVVCCACNHICIKKGKMKESLSGNVKEKKKKKKKGGMTTIII
jgi:hypothetical protein